MLGALGVLALARDLAGLALGRRLHLLPLCRAPRRRPRARLQHRRARRGLYQSPMDLAPRRRHGARHPPRERLQGARHRVLAGAGGRARLAELAAGRAPALRSSRRCPRAAHAGLSDLGHRRTRDQPVRAPLGRRPAARQPARAGIPSLAIAGVVLAAAVATRPDGVIFAAVGVAGAWWVNAEAAPRRAADSWPRPSRSRSTLAGVALVAFKLRYYGDLFPTAFYSKSALDPYLGAGMVLRVPLLQEELVHRAAGAPPRGRATRHAAGPGRADAGPCRAPRGGRPLPRLRGAQRRRLHVRAARAPGHAAPLRRAGGPARWRCRAGFCPRRRWRLGGDGHRAPVSALRDPASASAASPTSPPSTRPIYIEARRVQGRWPPGRSRACPFAAPSRGACACSATTAGCRISPR